jgi:hypothetical protein
MSVRVPRLTSLRANPSDKLAERSSIYPITGESVSNTYTNLPSSDILTVPNVRLALLEDHGPLLAKSSAANPLKYPLADGAIDNGGMYSSPPAAGVVVGVTVGVGVGVSVIVGVTDAVIVGVIDGVGVIPNVDVTVGVTVGVGVGVDGGVGVDDGNIIGL